MSGIARGISLATEDLITHGGPHAAPIGCSTLIQCSGGRMRDVAACRSRTGAGAQRRHYLDAGYHGERYIGDQGYLGDDRAPSGGLAVDPDHTGASSADAPVTRRRAAVVSAQRAPGGAS